MALTLDLHDHRPRPVKRYDDSGRDIDVLFFGNFRDHVVEDLKQRFSPPLWQLVDKITGLAYKANHTPLFEVFEQALQANNAPLPFDSDEYFSFMRALDLRVRHERRQKMLKSIEKFNCHVVSNVHYDVPNFTWHKPCSWPDIQALTDRAKIVIADMPSHTESINERVLCGLAQNAFVITFANNGMMRTFEQGENLVMFDMTDDTNLPMLIEYYLGRPGDRKRIAEAGGDKVRAEYTYKQTVEHILKHVETALPR